jgi:hypothetical protein
MLAQWIHLKANGLLNLTLLIILAPLVAGVTAYLVSVLGKWVRTA